MKRNRLFFPLTTHFPPAHLTKSVDFSLFLLLFFAGDRVSMRVRMLLGFGCGFKGMLFKTDEDGVNEKKILPFRFSDTVIAIPLFTTKLILLNFSLSKNRQKRRMKTLFYYYTSFFLRDVCIKRGRGEENC